TCTICILSFTSVETGLSKQSGLLVTCSTCDRDSSLEQALFCHAVNLAGWFRCRKHRFRNLKSFKNLIIPLKSINVKQHCSCCVGVICYVNLLAGQVVDQPCINGTEH